MTARFGRNKRRAAREEILALEAMATIADGKRELAERAARAAQYRERNAFEYAFAKFVADRDLITYAMGKISHELVSRIGPELAPMAERLLRSDRRGEPPLRFEASRPMLSEPLSYVIRGIVDVNYSVVVRGEP